MKKRNALFIIVLSAFYTLTLFIACATTPPPAPTAVTPPPPAAETAAPPAAEIAAPPAEPAPDMSPPEISVELTPQPYCPISPDGEEQFLTVTVHVTSASPIYAWHFEMRESESNELFLSLDQGGEVPEFVTWDGRNLKGELVESAATYNFSLTVANIYHNSLIDENGNIIPDDKRDEVAGQLVNGAATYEGTLTIDVLVQKEGKNLLRIIVPSIIFAPNTEKLSEGLDPSTSASNDRILRRIAEVLNHFGTYKVRVEGHANPTYPPNSKLRASEENGTRRIVGLKPLSEKRAKAVVEYLVKLGIDRSRLTPVGIGGKKIRAEFYDRPNWWKNRRVEFVLEKPEE